MKPLHMTWILALGFSLSAQQASAEDLEGRIQSVDPRTKTFVLHGVTFYVSPTTDFDGPLKGFGDLKVGLNVEVDFEYRDGKHHATEIELED